MDGARCRRCGAIVGITVRKFSHRGNNRVVNRENPFARESRRMNRLFATALNGTFDPAAYPTQDITAGQTVLHAGATPVALPRVESGRLHAVVHLGEEGQRVVPVSFDAGEIAMCSHLFSHEPLTADIVAAADSVVRWLPRSVIEAAVSTRPELALPLVQFLAQRLREVQARERVWLQRGVRARLWAVLMREIGGQEPAPDGTWTVSMTHEALAERAGVSRPKLSQALKALEREGALRLGRRAITVVRT
jgi:CRP-like cAMP-binding protein